MSKMIFHRCKKTGNFTTTDNGFLQNPNLSLQAKGLFQYLLSLPDNWEWHTSELLSHFTNGRRAFESALSELKKHGYIKQHGKFDKSTYEIFELPQSMYAQNVYTQNVHTQNANTQNADTHNVQLQNTHNTKDLSNKALNKQMSDVGGGAKNSKPEPFDVLCFAQDYCDANHIDCNVQSTVDKFFSDCEPRNWKDPTGEPIRDWKKYLAKSYLERERKAPESNASGYDALAGKIML